MTLADTDVHVFAHLFGHLHSRVIFLDFRSSPLSSSCPCRRKACLGALLNQATLKLSLSAEDVEYHLAGCRSGINAAVVEGAEAYFHFSATARQYQ